jgi:hypothetical protein
MRRFTLAAALLLTLSGSLAAQTTEAAPPLPFQSQVFVIPVAVSAPGQNGSFFRTAVQAYNGGLTPIIGTFIFRPQGSSITGANVSLAYTINPGETIYFADLLAAMGQTGIGSVDVTAANGTTAPVLSVRVFNDAGSAGTTGFTENVKKANDIIGVGSNVVLVAPFDPAAFRFNIGVRTFSAGTSIEVTVRDQKGAVRKTLSLSYGPNFFQQFDASSFLGGLAPNASDTITVFVKDGGLVLYATTADNTTNDPALQDPQPIISTAPTGTPSF